MPVKFQIGRTVITPGALKAISESTIQQSISRHLTGDWGDVCPEDARANEHALGEYARLLSVYHDGSGTKFWIITEADRSVTTILLPNEY